jgi:uncharacterized membrane protein YfcA
MIPQVSAITLLLIGCLAGVISGMVGIGGGIIVIPLLIYVAGYPQLAATGTSLAVLLPPIGLAAAVYYYRSGNVDLRAAMLIAAAFFFSAWGGAWFAKRLDPSALRVMLGVVMIAAGVYTIFFQGKMAR